MYMYVYSMCVVMLCKEHFLGDVLPVLDVPMLHVCFISLQHKQDYFDAAMEDSSSIKTLTTIVLTCNALDIVLK